MEKRLVHTVIMGRDLVFLSNSWTAGTSHNLCIT
jgi:hypothetical protein